MFTRAMILVKMCGNECAQVVAAHLPALVQRTWPGAELITISAGRDGAFEDPRLRAAIGIVVLLPADASRRRQLWYRCYQSLPVGVSVLPIVVGDSDFEEDEASTAGIGNLDISFSPALFGWPSPIAGQTFRGEQVLPTLRVSGCEARIEHGGHFHLERETARELQDGIRRLLHPADRGVAAAPEDGRSAANGCPVELVWSQWH